MSDLELSQVTHASQEGHMASTVVCQFDASGGPVPLK